MSLKATRSERAQLRTRKLRNRRIALIAIALLVLAGIVWGVVSLLGQNNADAGGGAETPTTAAASAEQPESAASEKSGADLPAVAQPSVDVSAIANLPLGTEAFVVTASGLEYQDVVVGAGAEAQTGDTVLMHYTGWLLDGKKFDSSRDRMQTFDFTLGQSRVIQGWEEGVQGMRVGGQRILVIPAELGYGAQGAGSAIPGGATLVFEVELVDIPQIQVEELLPGSGKTAETGATVDVHYKGMFEDGTVFDSSYERDTPLTFEVGANRVIPGFEQGVLGMQEGGKRKVTIPPALGYGDNGSPSGSIPPNTTLVFEIELVAVK